MSKLIRLLFNLGFMLYLMFKCYDYAKEGDVGMTVYYSAMMIVFELGLVGSKIDNLGEDNNA